MAIQTAPSTIVVSVVVGEETSFELREVSDTAIVYKSTQYRGNSDAGKECVMTITRVRETLQNGRFKIRVSLNHPGLDGLGAVVGVQMTVLEFSVPKKYRSVTNNAHLSSLLTMDKVITNATLISALNAGDWFR